MPRIDLDILNQKQTPAFYASSLATRPAAGFVGRIFIDSDSPSTGLYRDTGTTWVQIADPGAGTTGTLQQVTTNGNSTTTGITITTNGLGIGTTIPGSNRLDIHSASGINATFNGTGTTNAALQLQLAGVGKWTLQNNYNSAANDFVITDVLNSLNRLIIKNNGSVLIGQSVYSGYLLDVAGTGRFTGNVIGNTIFSNGDSFLDSPNQFQITGSTNTNKQLVIGLNTTSNYGCIQPTLFGTGYYPLCLNPLGANVILGSFTDVGSKFQCNGTAFISGNTGIGTSSPQTSLSVDTSGTQNVISPIITGQTSSVTYGGIYTKRDGSGDQRGLIFQVYTANVGLNIGMTIKSSKIINLSNVPTTSAGLVSGDIYQTAGVLNIVP
jgi:hypothetical protein